MKKILVVDDRPANIMLMEDILKNAGYNVISAMDGEKGLKCAVEQHPDLIISDILMPNVDGFQFCHTVRNTPELAGIPFLFLTGAYVSDEDEKFAISLGANRFMRRPFKTDDLLDIVQELLNSQMDMESSLPLDMDEEEYLKQHVGRLTYTLEDKVVELEAVTEQNTRLLRDAKRHEAQLQKSLVDLQETQTYLVQSERLSAVGQLVAGVAHELNNPLAIILGYAQLILRMPEASSRMTECLKKLEDAAQRCQSIVHHLTIFAQKQKVEKRHLNINDVIRSVIDIRKDQFELDQIDVSVTLDPRLLVVFADYQQLQQVFLSLINNAQEAMLTNASPDRKIQIISRLQNDMATIDFIDNGPGVKNAELAKLFEPFFTTKEFGQGIGLGLSVCYGIITEHQGNIIVSHTEGGGATFTVTLPLYSVGDRSEQETAASGAEPGARSRRHRILIVDDEPGILDILSSALRQAGYIVETALRGEEGIKRITSEAFDLVLLDIRLPDCDGSTLYRRIQDINAELATRIIFITGDTVSRDTHTFIEQTGNPFVNKPFDIEIVRQLVTETLVDVL